MAEFTVNLVCVVLCGVLVCGVWWSVVRPHTALGSGQAAKIGRASGVAHASGLSNVIGSKPGHQPLS
jgi:hypothetical protein